MIGIIILWFILGFLTFGTLTINFIWMKKVSKKPWYVRINGRYRPKISIIVPTYNEASVILFKLRNLRKTKYPRKLIQIVIVDSGSNDGTTELVSAYLEENLSDNIEIFVEEERKGKSAALNAALKLCKGDVVIVSDADCFWPSDILEKTLPFLSDPSVGAISGPKKILNVDSSSVAASEDSYLNSMNTIKLGESKIHSTILFEGGFSVYKREILRSFDPYNTGSDDCGTVIDVIKQGYRAIMLPEGAFFTMFPKSWKEKIEMKIRRAGQLIKVLKTYTTLLIKKEIKNGRTILIKNIFVYLFSPIFFLFFIFCSIYLMLNHPPLILVLSAFFVPKLRVYLIEAIIGYITLIIAIISWIIKRDFSIWKTPKDRVLFTESMLVQKDLL
jgi:cellulose synthase/poly-beta-1,6-N-acetylglucosamine synthase-like glycosyltransferase